MTDTLEQIVAEAIQWDNDVVDEKSLRTWQAQAAIEAIAKHIGVSAVSFESYLSQFKERLALLKGQFDDN